MKVDKVIVALIICLFFASSPSAVFWTVRTVIIDAVDGIVMGWTFTHVVKERFEGIPPTFTDENATSSIPIKGGFIVIVASLAHSDPGFMFLCFCHAVHDALAQKPFKPLFSPKTSAALCIAGFQGVTRCNVSGTAIALAMPKSGTAVIHSSVIQDFQSAEDLTSQVDDALWKCARIVSGHCHVSFSDKVVVRTALALSRHAVRLILQVMGW